MFYSDGPEDLIPKNTSIACVLDPAYNGFTNSPYYLLKETLTGTFRIFAFHKNNTGYNVNADIILRNTSGSTVTVTLYHYSSNSESTIPGPMGVTQWFDFAASTQTSFSLANNQVTTIPQLSLSSLANEEAYTILADIQHHWGQCRCVRRCVLQQ